MPPGMYFWFEVPFFLMCLTISHDFWKISSRKDGKQSCCLGQHSLWAVTGNAFLTLLKWAITRLINLVKTSFLVTATLPLHLDMKGAPEKRKSSEAHRVGLNLFCFQKLNKWSFSIITSAVLSGIAFFYFFVFSFGRVWFGMVTLPSRVAYVYLELLSQVLEMILPPWMSVFHCPVQPGFRISTKFRQ